MAINIVIPKDITKYEAKLIGPLTTRQTVCAVPACVLGIFAFMVLSKYATRDTAIFASMIIIVPLILLGWYKPYGIPLEKFIKTIFVTMVMAPKNRKYKTYNMFFIPSEDKTKTIQNKKKKKQEYISKNPENISYK